MASRMAYSSAGAAASIIPGQSISVTAQQAATVPVTGLHTSGAESYCGQSISHIAVNAGQTVTIPLGGSTPTSAPTATPVSTSTSTSVPTATATSAPTNTPRPTNTPTLVPTPTITPVVNHPPVANADSYSMHLLNVLADRIGSCVLGNDTDADGDSLTAVLVTGTSNGVLIFNADGGFTYTPVTSLLTFNDSFTYKAFDGIAYSSPVTVTIRVNVP